MTTKKRASRSKSGRQSSRTKQGVQIPAGVTLSPTQLIFIEEYLVSGNKKAAAEKAGVNRTTPYDWFRNDFEFVAEYNRRFREFQEEVQAGLVALEPLTVEAIRASIADHNMETVWKLRDLLERLKPEESRAENADRLLKEAITEEIFGMSDIHYRLGNAMARLSDDLSLQGWETGGTRLLELLRRAGLVEEREVVDEEEDEEPGAYEGEGVPA